MLGYDTYPHIDQKERGLEAAAILDRIWRTGFRPKMALAQRPLFPHILGQLTDRAPMSDAIAIAHELEQNPEIVCVSVAAGFPYCDVPEAGLSVYAVAGHLESAQRAADQIADHLWSRRGEFHRSLPDTPNAVRRAIENPSGLTVLVDVGDNLGAGTPGDGTVILNELLVQHAQDALVLLCDPEAVATAARAGVRERVHLKAGGKTDRYHGDPVEVEGSVLTLSDGIFRNIGPMRDGVVDDQGRTAVIRSGGVLLVLTERRMPMWNLEQLRRLGIEPTRLRIVVVKAAIAYRAAYAPIAKQIIEVDTPGLASADIKRYSYHHLRRPIYPLDAI
jgi:microcystin degradation protein MlrC